MSYYRQAPLFRLVIPFIAGILIAVYTSGELPLQWLIFGLLLTSLSVVYRVRMFFIKYRYRVVFGLILEAFLLLSGYVLTKAHTGILQQDHYSHYYQPDNWVLGIVDKMPVEKAKSYKVTLEIGHLRIDSRWKAVSGQALIYLQKSDSAATVKYGDELLLKPQFKEVPAPQNPGEFNYRQYLRFHQIYEQSYVPTGNWMSTGNNEGFGLLVIAQAAREYFLHLFQHHNLEGDEFAVASALILGYKDELGKDLRRAYAGAGAMHVLAVSGLHVGIMFIVLNSLLVFLERFRYGVVIKAVLLTLALWFYAMLTGLSPSVLRAATMFTFIVWAKPIGRSTNIFNTLAASAFFLLLMNPFIIMQVGFQLSYLAVISIVYLQPKLYHLFAVNNWLLDKIWAITTVSFAAQLATFPLGLLYFHQFPNLFLFSNLVVIPMAALILYLGMAVFVFSPLDLICGWLTKALDYVVWFLNEAVRFIEQLPYSITEEISISVFETWLIYFLIAALLALYTLNKLKYLKVGLCIMIALLVMQMVESYHQWSQRKFIVYKVSKQPAYDFIDGKRNYFMANPELNQNIDKMLFHIKHNWWDMGVARTSFIDKSSDRNYRENTIYCHGDFIQYYNKRIAIIDSNYVPKRLDKPMEVDYLIISGKPYVQVENLKNQFDFAQLIIDSSTPDWKAKKWQKEARELDIPCHAVGLQGAFVAEL